MPPPFSPSPARTLLRLLVALALAALMLLVGLGLAAAQSPGTLTRVTTAYPAGRGSESARLNADGSRIAFDSDSDFLGQGIPQGQYEIWLYNTKTMTVTRVTTATGAGGRDSYAPSLSADGTRIAFSSNSDLLGQGIPADHFDIWLYDTKEMTVTRVVTSASNRGSFAPRLSADGTRMAFQSNSDFLGQGISQYQTEVWLYDTRTMTVTRVSTATAADRDQTDASISRDGTRIAFRSDSDFLGQGIPKNQTEVWLYDTRTMTVTRITTATGAGGRHSDEPSLNADGTRVAFRSDSDFLGQGIPIYGDEIWLYDTHTMTVTRVTTASASGRNSFSPDLSAVGTRITFFSPSDFLGQNDIASNQDEIWLYDTKSMTVTRITFAASGRYSVWPAISGDGTRIAFESDADFLNLGIPPGQSEIWLWEPLPALRLTKSADDPTARPGQRITYSVVISNSGGTAGGARVSDTLDPRLRFLGPVRLDPPGAGTAGTPPTLASGLTIQAGGRVTLTFSVELTSTGIVSGTAIANTAAVTSRQVSAPATGTVMILIGPAETYLPVVAKSGP